MPSSSASSSPRTGTGGGPLRRHSSAAGISSSASSRCASIARSAFLPRVASRSATDSSVTSTSTGRRSLEVAVDGAPVERALVDQEAEHEVVAGHGLEEAAQALARPEPAADRAHHLLAEPVVPHEGHAAVLANVVGGGLADVVEQRAESERLAARELVRERLVQHLAQLAGWPSRSSSISRSSTSSVCP